MTVTQNQSNVRAFLDEAQLVSDAVIDVIDSGLSWILALEERYEKEERVQYWHEFQAALEELKPGLERLQRMMGR